uniref:Phosphatidylserine decarboxylase proenzyme, mitochondrial n=1 Tax=Ornithodoros turicata TaxID=34597 RepID=A0A2R5LN66_9ACAR
MWFSHRSLPLLLLTTQRGASWVGRQYAPYGPPRTPLLTYSFMCHTHLRHMSNTASSRASLSSRQTHQSSSISPPQGPRYFRSFRWLTIPLGLGFAYFAYQHLRSAHNGDKASQVIASDLQVSFYTMLPLRMASRWWGWANDIELPLWVRSPILRFFSWMFCCNINEAEVDDLRQYRNLGEFFRRTLKPGLRPVHAGECVVSPADGTVLHFGRIEKGFVEQVKGITYSLPRFLGPHPWDPHCLHSGDEEQYHQKLLENKGTELYHCVVYLAPGDYHRFHSPVQWEVQHRRHFPGTLLSVRPGVVSWIAGLFNMNERVVYMGHWAHGFFSMTAVGATNVGSIKVYFDKDLVTNTRKYKKHAFQDKCFQSNHNSEGVHLEKGDPFGEFNLGSTIVLIFEAPAGFNLQLHKGQKIKYGELVCEHGSAKG